MPKRTLSRAAALPACFAAIVLASLAWAGQPAVNPQTSLPVKVVASEFGSNFVPLGIGKSVVVDLPRDLKGFPPPAGPRCSISITSITFR
jgi:hypothetical protein